MTWSGRDYSGKKIRGLIRACRGHDQYTMMMIKVWPVSPMLKSPAPLPTAGSKRPTVSQHLLSGGWQTWKELDKLHCKDLTFTFYFFFSAVLSEWDFSHGKSGCLPRGKPAATESRYPTYGACWVFSVSIIHRILTCTTGSLTCAQM